MKLNSRQNNILLFLMNSKDYLTASEIAESFQISNKTVYRDLDKINMFLKKYDASLEIIKGVGTNIKIDSQTKALLFNEIKYNRSNETNKLNLDLENRRLQLKLLLLESSPRKTSITKLSDKFYVSRSSIVEDIKLIKDTLNNSNINLKTAKDGTYITGNEKDIRDEINETILKLGIIEVDNNDYYDGRLNSENFKILSTQFNKEMIISVESVINEMEQKLGYTIGDPYYINMLTHILIAIARIRESNYVDLGTKDRMNINVHVYRIVCDAAHTLSKRFNINLPDSEINFLYLHLISSGVGKVNDKKMISHKIQEFDNIEKSFYTQLLKNVSEAFEIDISNDIILNNDLYFHITSMLNRLKLNIKIVCPLAKQIKDEFSKMYEIVTNSMSMLMKKFFPKLIITEDEICFVVLYFQAAYEKSLESVNIIIVCSTGVATSQLLKRRVENKFPNWNIIDVLSAKNFKNYDLTDVDLILSTIRLENFVEIDKKIVYISALLNNEDVIAVNNEIYKK